MYTYKYSPNGMGKFTITISSQKRLRTAGKRRNTKKGIDWETSIINNFLKIGDPLTQH